MPYHYEWLQPRRVIFCYVYGEQSFEEAHDSMQQLVARLDQGSHPTHYIVDTRANTRMPTTNIRQFRRMVSFLAHPHLGWTVAIVNHPVTSYVFSLVAKLTRARYRAVETPEEALDFLQSTDPTIRLEADLNQIIAQLQNQSQFGK